MPGGKVQGLAARAYRTTVVYSNNMNTTFNTRSNTVLYIQSNDPTADDLYHMIYSLCLKQIAQQMGFFVCCILHTFVYWQ